MVCIGEENGGDGGGEGGRGDDRREAAQGKARQGAVGEGRREERRWKRGQPRGGRAGVYEGRRDWWSCGSGSSSSNGGSGGGRRERGRREIRTIQGARKTTGNEEVINAGYGNERGREKEREERGKEEGKRRQSRRKDRPLIRGKRTRSWERRGQWESGRCVLMMATETHTCTYIGLEEEDEGGLYTKGGRKKAVMVKAETGHIEGVKVH
ncbi:hypothetical protein BJ684DRAFT_17283 [Piptocephalis cylindrospora]|uniref:Uncharacterized protein n=1 Tax=Piptocephalis cylindrospora TaxID=1907219 RepID=A0A4P9Y0D2_9FUNG|nr:hypothetical protein BJ684DRAFT_17283 [Piptocephalis cylindrospora]|eukprot:RKP12205.1 hypothetical protein BJ684DRAFT_17283 [Piptocephalis cylindrospora]